MSRFDEIKSNLLTRPILCSNLGFGEQGALLSKVDSAIFIAPDREKAHEMKSQLDSLNKDCVVMDDFDKPFTPFTYSSNENINDQISVINNLLFKKSIIITTARALFSIFPNLEKYKTNFINLQLHSDYDLSKLNRDLTRLGYTKVEAVQSIGEYSLRGDILDIFVPSEKFPFRLDFFDTNLDDIYTFDPLTYEKIEKQNALLISPNSLLILDDGERDDLVNKMHSFANDENILQDVISQIERNENVPIEFLVPYIETQTLIELNLPIIFSNSIQIENQINKLYNEFSDKISDVFNSEKLKNLYENTKKYENIDKIYEKYANKLIFFENFEIDSIDLFKKFENDNPLALDFNYVNLPSFLRDLKSIYSVLQPYIDKQIYLCLGSLDTLNSIKKIFDELTIPYTTNTNSHGLILSTLNIPYNICFKDEDKFYIGSTNFAHKKVITKTTRNNVKYLPKAGEYVVHSTHGIGKCEGVVSVNVSGVDKEFFKLTYRGGDTLYVPCERADCLSLYMADGDNVTLNKLGGKEFLNQKLKAIKSIEDMSRELIELYAKRKSAKGYKYSEDDYLYNEFENTFKYKETSDQLQAIADVKRDMISGKVMDRLICGDVGFGKTEVAMRALFKAVEDGKQVAMLAPTTVLSMQHFMTASERTRDFGVKVEMLNRFRSKSEQAEILSKLESGEINVICGTHRLLSADVKFKDLGLLILDEEQRFGVKAKEKLKQLKNNVDVLTLSATPIPRTLSMSLMSIRDISIINTPPINRLPIKTYVTPYQDEIILPAINDELKRGGQVLIVYNNIEELYKFAESLKSKLNNENARIDVAHGQMSEVALENAVKRLYDGETNIFVSTTLIENGVDLPKANTLIVLDSDKLGLSQMYQLRGRVGRSTEQAYAYFTYKKGKVLSEDSANRLQAIAENTELGSGFKIAMRDLTIRGAGELLGKVQHGHMVKIGYDMYMKLLNDTLRRLNGENVEEIKDIKLDIAIPSKIPYSFIEDEGERLKIIAKISNIVDKDTLRNCIGELITQYGKLPNEIYNLANITLIKSLAQAKKVKSITITKSRIAITYYEEANVSEIIDKVRKFSHFKFENGALPTITLSPLTFSPLTATKYILEFFLDSTK